MLVKQLLDHCVKSSLTEAHKILRHLWTLGYSAEDILSIVFRVLKNHPMEEYLKLEFIKVHSLSFLVFIPIRIWLSRKYVPMQFIYVDPKPLK